MTTMTRGLRDMSPSPTLKTVAIEFDEGIVVELHVAEDYGDDDILLVAEIISDHLASGAPYEELNIGQVMEDILAAGPGDGTYIDPEDLIHVDMSNSFEMIVDPSLHKYIGQINSTDGDTLDRFRRYSISPAFYRIISLPRLAMKRSFRSTVTTFVNKFQRWRSGSPMAKTLLIYCLS
jgi:hypothetical protein